MEGQLTWHHETSTTFRAGRNVAERRIQFAAWKGLIDWFDLLIDKHCRYRCVTLDKLGTCMETFPGRPATFTYEKKKQSNGKPGTGKKKKISADIQVYDGACCVQWERCRNTTQACSKGGGCSVYYESAVFICVHT
jgi:hypothetical protein